MCISQAAWQDRRKIRQCKYVQDASQRWQQKYPGWLRAKVTNANQQWGRVTKIEEIDNLKAGFYPPPCQAIGRLLRGSWTFATRDTGYGGQRRGSGCTQL